MTAMTAKQARGKYISGRAFEYRVIKALHASGYACSRGAGSKGSTKADVIGFSPHGAILIVQAKHDGKISIDEWDRLYDVASWSSRMIPATDHEGWTRVEYRPVIPILAYVNARGNLLMDELTGERVRSKPNMNRAPYEWRCACDPPHPNLSPPKGQEDLAG
jgi:hypothetical protein